MARWCVGWFNDVFGDEDIKRFKSTRGVLSIHDVPVKKRGGDLSPNEIFSPRNANYFISHLARASSCLAALIKRWSIVPRRTVRRESYDVNILRLENVSRAKLSIIAPRPLWIITNHPKELGRGTGSRVALFNARRVVPRNLWLPVQRACDEKRRGIFFFLIESRARRVYKVVR